MTLSVDLTGAEPASIPRGRTGNIMVRDHVTGTMAPLDKGKVYTLISCYANGDPLDNLCQTSGAQNLRFLLADGTTMPAKSNIPAGTNVMFPVPAIINYLKANGGVVPATSMGRITAVNNFVPVSLFAGDPLVQATQGAGPAWLGRNDPAAGMTLDMTRALQALQAKLLSPGAKPDNPATTGAGVDDYEMSYDE
jgi:hypothetical protein